METYTIVITVRAKSQAIAFGFVETAIDMFLPLAATPLTPERIHVATADGTIATDFECPEAI